MCTLTDMHVRMLVQIIVYIHLVHTQVLCTRASMSWILRAHTCIYVSEIKNVSCRVHDARVFSQV